MKWTQKKAAADINSTLDLEGDKALKASQLTKKQAQKYGEEFDSISNSESNDEEMALEWHDLAQKTHAKATNPSKSECQNCGAVHDDSDLEEIEDIHERVEPGEEMPSGECPDCGCLCQPVKQTKRNPRKSSTTANFFLSLTTMMRTGFVVHGKDQPKPKRRTS